MKKLIFPKTFLIAFILLIANLLMAQPNIISFTPASGPVGTLVTVSGTNLSNPTALTIGGVSAITVSNNGNTLVAMVMPGATTGIISITTTVGTATSLGNFTLTATNYPSAQQGSKLVGTGAAGSAGQGISLAISADGNTAIVGGPHDNSNIGAVWIYTRNGGIWSQQGSKLVGTGAIGAAYQGQSVALSADGNTAIVGGYNDNGLVGAAWVYTRNGGVWTQQDSKLVGNDALGNAQQGFSVSLSADGNTALVGGPSDISGAGGAVWVFTRGGAVWTQQGNKLSGTGGIIGSFASQGQSVSLSADGNTAIVGGRGDNNSLGAAWIFARSGSVWTQQGSKLVGTGSSLAAWQGSAVSISADGNTAIVGGYNDIPGGAAWVFTRSAGVWTQQGSKIAAGTGTPGSPTWQGFSVSISADGNTAIIGGFSYDNQGSAAVYTRSSGVWIQQGTNLLGPVGSISQTFSVSLSADGKTAIVGGWNENNAAGAVWLYSIRNTWTGNTNTDWNTASNWSLGSVPVSSDPVFLPNASNQPIIGASTSATANNIIIQNGSILNIASGGTLTPSGTITLNPGAAITGSYAGITGNATLQQNIVGQRGFRLFANPFSTSQTNLSGSGLNATTTTANDVKIWLNASNAWQSAGSGYGSLTIGVNSPYACFIRGASTDYVTGLNYTTGPSAFTYNVSGTLNPATTSITPSNASNFMIVGNPYAAPVNTKALTGQTATGYYTYQISVTGSPQVKAGSWVVSGANSNTSTTIPVLGVVAYKPANTSTFSITTSDINTGGTLQTGIGLFGGEPPSAQLELSVEQNGYFQDRMFIRLDPNATANGTDKNDLQKFYNDIVNLYSLAPADNTRLAIDARNVLSTIPLGISAMAGTYNFKLNSSSLPEGITVYLKDNQLNTQTALNTGDTYNFSISSDTASMGEHRFELVFNSKQTVSLVQDNTGTLKATILGNITQSNQVGIEIAGASGPVMVSIKDAAGRPVGSTTAVNGIQYINIGNAGSGMLIIQISDSKSSITQKVIKL